MFFCNEERIRTVRTGFVRCLSFPASYLGDFSGLPLGVDAPPPPSCRSRCRHNLNGRPFPALRLFHPAPRLLRRLLCPARGRGFDYYPTGLGCRFLPDDSLFHIHGIYCLFSSVRQRTLGRPRPRPRCTTATLAVDARPLHSPAGRYNRLEFHRRSCLLLFQRLLLLLQHFLLLLLLQLLPLLLYSCRRQDDLLIPLLLFIGPLRFEDQLSEDRAPAVPVRKPPPQPLRPPAGVSYVPNNRVKKK